jgi:hypothetical protein
MSVSKADGLRKKEIVIAGNELIYTCVAADPIVQVFSIARMRPLQVAGARQPVLPALKAARESASKANKRWPREASDGFSIGENPITISMPGAK